MRRRSSPNRIFKRITIRMPQEWKGKITDQKLSTLLDNVPDKLPPDPGGGSYRRSFAFSSEEWQTLKRNASSRRLELSVFVRRLIASKLGFSSPPVPRQVPKRKTPLPTSPILVVPRSVSAGQRFVSQNQEDGKRAFQKYVEELERIARSGTMESGEAQVRLARIREIAARRIS